MPQTPDAPTDSSTRAYDVVVIGGGPGGAAVATLLAKVGRSVALFEKRSFPRFHVGESLVPAVNLTLDKLGVLGDLDRLGFPRKHGVQFFSPDKPSRPFYFSESGNERFHHSWQVLRSDFDELLLENAARAGVRVSTSTEVLGIAEADYTVSGVRLRESGRKEEVVSARVVIDAAGQRGLFAERLGQRAHIEGLENGAVFAHYRDVELDTGIDAGSTLIYRIDSTSWLWFIPLPETVSIGLVAPAQELPTPGTTPASILDDAIAACPPLAQRLTSARRTTEVRYARDFSYRCERDGGPGWLLVGDALGFMDPVYSTGLYLTMLSAELAAQAIDTKLDEGTASPDLTGYSTEYQQAFDRFLPLVHAFYRKGFSFSKLTADDHHRQGLVDLLIGDVGTPDAIGVSNAIAAMLSD